MTQENDMQAWQMSLFGGLLKERCDTKPEVGTRLVMHMNGNDYPCVVDAHCGFDFFYVKFTSRKPSDDDSRLDNTAGWHLSLRGYMESWDFPEE